MNSSSRNGAKVIWLAVHTTEGIMRAVDLRAWKTWPGSSHASSDETGVLLTPAEGFVPYERMAWTLRNANPISENIEQCGWSRWTRAEWLSRPDLLDATARWLGERSKARGIPLRRLSDAEIRAHKPGVLGHGDYSRATGDGTHSDPGPNYPWDVVLAKAQAYASGAHPDEELDMAISDDILKASKDAAARAKHLESMLSSVGVFVTTIAGTQAAQAEVLKQLAEKQGTPIDMAAISAVVEKGVADAIASIDTTVHIDTKAS